MIDLLFAAGLALVQTPAAPAEAKPPERPLTAAEAYSAMFRAAAAVTPLPIDDSTDHARRMASSDRNEARFFNRPGVTRVDYDRHWTLCRQIARRLASSRSDGTLMQAGFTQAGLLGGAILGGFDAAFSQRRARQDIRRQCMIASGYRLVMPDEAGRRLISGMSRDARNAWFDTALGAAQPPVAGRVIDFDAMVAAGGIRDAEEGGDD